MVKEIDQLTSLVCENLELKGKLAHARGAARIIEPKCYQAIVAAAREVGYAVAVHGSRARDVDLLAVPWTLEAKDPYRLVRAIAGATGAAVEDKLPRRVPTNKPHGRMSVVLFLHGTYIDLAIMPRKFGPKGGTV